MKKGSRAVHRTTKSQVEQALRLSEEKFRALVENANDVHFSVDAEGRITYISPVIERFAHYPESEIIGQSFARFVHPDDLPTLMASFTRTLSGDLQPFEFRIIIRDGELRHVRTSSRPLWDGDRLIGLTGVMVDITERKQAEEALQKAHAEMERRVAERTADLAQANRMLNILTECNQAVVRAVDEMRLLHNICRVLVEQGGYPLAWVGFSGPDGDPIVRPVAWARAGGGGSEAAGTTPLAGEDGGEAPGKIVGEPDAGEGGGEPATAGGWEPAAIAVRTGYPFIARDLQTDPGGARWREDAVRGGYASVIALPLAGDDGVLGVLNVYAAAPDAFQSQEAGLLMELAGDLAFGVTSLRERARRRRAEEQLQRLADLQTAILNNAPYMVISTDRDGIITTFNTAAESSLGYTAEECIGKLTPGVFHDGAEIIARARDFSDELGMAIEPGLPVFSEKASRNLPNEHEWTYIRKDGTRFPVLLSVTALRDANGEITGYQGMASDITNQKQAEGALWESSQMLKLVLDHMPAFVFWKDRDSVYLGCNNLFAANAGLNSPEQIIGLTDLDLPWKDTEAESYRADDRLVMDRGVPKINYEETQLTADGRLTDVRTSKIPLRDPQGNVIGVVGTFEDITERKQAERARQTLYEISQAVIAADRLDDLYISIHQILGGLMPAENFYIALYDPAGDVLGFPYFVDRFDADPPPVNPGNSLTGYVLRTGRSLLASPEVFQALVEAGEVELVGSRPVDWLGAPLKAGSRVIGVMAVQSYSQHVRYGKKEQDILEFVSAQVAMAIERKRSFEEVQLNLERLNALRAIDLALTSSFDLRLNLSVLLEQVLTQLAVDAACVMLLNPHTLTLEYAAGRGFRTRAPESARVRLGQSYAGIAALERRAIHLTDMAQIQESPPFAALLAGEAAVAYYAVPLIAKGQVKGVLEIFQRSPLAAEGDWVDFLKSLAGQAAIAIENAQLFENLQRSNVDLALAYDATIEGWARAIDLRDRETEEHTRRVSELTERLARALGMGEAEIVHVRRGAILHDIGKMGVPDSILLKPGPLTEEEWVIMRQHPQLAFEMLASIAFLRPAVDIPYCHHEKWDGSGYPRGLKGEQIPLAARLFAVIDVYDALISDRLYRAAWSREDTLQYIASLAGTHFDPRVVDVFMRTI